MAVTGARADVLAKALALRPQRLDANCLPARVETGGAQRVNAAWRALERR
jgi:hypothetical protein